MTRCSKVWIVVALASAIVVVSGALFGRPAYRQFKEKRAMNQAIRFFEKGDYRNAALSLRIALGTNPNNARAARLMADLLDQGQSSTALEWRRRAAEKEPILENKILLAACALRYEKPPFATAARALETIGDEGKTNLGFHLVHAQLAISASDLAKAQEHLRTAIQLDPTNRLHQVNLATLRLQSSDTNIAAQARSELIGLADEPLLGLTVLRSLTSDRLAHGDLNQAQTFAGRLQARADALLSDRLLHLAVLKRAASPAFSEALGGIQQRCTNALATAQVLHWMISQKMAEPALEWSASIPKATRETMPVPIALAECYQAAKNFSGLQDYLTGRRWDDQEFLRLAFMSRAAREQGQAAHSERFWKQAANGAVSNPQRLATLLRLAQLWGWQDEFKHLLWTAAERSPAQNWPLEVLLGEYAFRSDTEGLYRVFAALLERNTNSLELKNNVAAMGLLLGTNVARCAELARESYEAATTNATVVSTYAFSLHAQGKTAEALQIFRNLPEPDLTRPEIALYYGVLLAAAGNHQEARPYLALAESHNPFPQERLLLEKARASVQQ